MAKGEAEKTKEEKGPRSFARFIELVSEGEANMDASLALFELGNALQNESLRLNQKVKGELTLTFKMSCDARGVMGIDFDVKTKVPKKKRATAQAWVNKDGNTVFEPPRQIKLPLREVGGPAEALEVSTGEIRPVREV